MNTFIRFTNELSRPWADAMLRACWQGGLALLIAWLLCRVWPKMPASVKCWIWRLAYLKLLVTFLWFAPINLPLLSPYAQKVTSSALEDRGRGGFSRRAEPAANSAVEAAPTPVSAAEAANTPQPAAHSPAASVHVTSALAAIWLFGVLVCACRIMLDWRRMRRLRRGSKSSDDFALQSCCHDLVRQMGLRRTPLLFTSSHASSPVLIGIFRSRIILPENLGCSDSQQRMLLAHELAHILRRDLLWNWLAAICQSLFFFHPLVWLASHHWRMHREIACDQAAIAVAGTSPAEYGNVLLRFSLNNQLAARGVLAVGMAENFGNLERRLLAMRHIQTWSKRRWATAGAILSIVAAIGIIPWRVVAQPARAAGEQPPAAPAVSAPRTGEALRAARHPLGSATYVGQLSAPTVRMSARVDGMVKEVAVATGDRVKKGQVLLKLDDTKQRLALMTQQVEYENAARELDRLRQLGTAVTAQSELRKAETAVQLAKIGLELRQQELGEMTITAPFAGVVSNLRIHADEFASKGSVLLTILDIDHLSVRLLVPEIALSTIQKGQKVTIRADAFPQQKFDGEIDMIAPEVQPGSGMIQISARVANQDEKLRPGMTARVTPVTPEKTE